MSAENRGSVVPVRDRSGRTRWRVRATIDGRRVSLGVYDHREDANVALADALARVDTTSHGRTLASWGETWLADRATGGLHRQQHKAASLWRAHVSSEPFALWPLRRIARTDVVRWVRALLRTEATSTSTTGKAGQRVTTRKPLGRRLSRQTVTNALALLRRALEDAADEGHVPANVARGVSVPRTTRTDEPWTWLRADEIAALLAPPLSPERRAVFTVAIWTGLRAGELWGLRWADVRLDGDAPELLVRHSYRGPTKGGKPRRVPLLRQAREALSAWRTVAPGIGAALVFPADTRTADGLAGCHAEGYDAGLSTALRHAGIVRPGVHFHSLRHTCGSHLVQGTWGPAMRLEDVRQWLGHASITTTERYAHLSPEGLAGLARAIDDRDSIGTPADAERPSSRRK